MLSPQNQSERQNTPIKIDGNENATRLQKYNFGFSLNKGDYSYDINKKGQLELSFITQPTVFEPMKN